ASPHWRWSYLRAQTYLAKARDELPGHRVAERSEQDDDRGDEQEQRDPGAATSALGHVTTVSARPPRRLVTRRGGRDGLAPGRRGHGHFWLSRGVILASYSVASAE